MIDFEIRLYSDTLPKLTQQAYQALQEKVLTLQVTVAEVINLFLVRQFNFRKLLNPICGLW